MTLTYCFDVEVFQNLFTATFVNVADEQDKHVFHIGLGKADYSDIVSFLKQEMELVGYNNISYDNPMLRYIMAYKGPSINRDLFALSSKLVNDFYRDDQTIRKLRYPRPNSYLWTTVDLMAMLAFDKLGISLKQTAINLKWHRIQDLPIEFDRAVGDTELEMVLDYNLNDVLITKKLYEVTTPLRELRRDLSKIYGINLNSASDSKMGNLIINSMYTTVLNVDINSIKDLRTKRDKVLLGDCIPKYVKFQTPELQDMLERIKSTYVYSYNRFKYDEKIYYAGCDFNIGVGGLHTKDEAGMFISDEKYLIQDMDGASYYPNLIINNNFYPEHLGPTFITLLKKITAERIAAKKSGDKVKAEGLKITINGLFGKLNSPTYMVEDAKQMLSTTVTGQMGLMMLVEDLHLNGIQVISCNTDGIVCKIDRQLESKYYECAKRWEKIFKIDLEFTPYRKYVRRDVNSYITEKMDGKTKEKGAFVRDVDLKKSYHMPIVGKALYAYFFNGIPIRQTIENCKDIMEFCLSQKSGKDFGMELHKNSGIEHLQKTNRVFVSKKGGRFIKRKHITEKTSGLYVGRLVSIINEYDSTLPFENYDVDLSYYEKEAMKIIDAVEPKQISMFDLSTIDRGSKTKMEAPNASKMVKEEPTTILELNKLGSIQFSKRIDSIVSEGLTIENISPRYAYIKALDQKEMTVSLYCLRKGSVQTVGVDRNAYSKLPLFVGKIVFCEKFKKEKGGYKLQEYRYVNAFNVEDPSLMRTM